MGLIRKKTQKLKTLHERLCEKGEIVVGYYFVYQKQFEDYTR